MLSLSAIATIIASPTFRVLGIALAVFIVISGTYWKGHRDGAAKIQAKWDRAELAAQERGAAARERAADDVRRGMRDSHDRND